MVVIGALGTLEVALSEVFYVVARTINRIFAGRNQNERVRPVRLRDGVVRIRRRKVKLVVENVVLETVGSVADRIRIGRVRPKVL